MLLEALLCNTLKARLGSQQAWPLPVLASQEAVLQAVSFLQTSRRQQMFHPNKTMLLERVLLVLSGHPFISEAA
jgi:hypothetical protein